MKKLIGIIIGVAMVTSVFSGCAKKADESYKEGQETNSVEEKEGFDKDITVVSREDGSGTRGAFIEICKIEEKNASGEKVDLTTDEAIIANSTSVVMTTVVGDETAIGYISLGSLNDTVKALEIDGVNATAENIKSGKYTVSRPFNIVKSEKSSAAANDFINFILSSQGQAVVEENGYISSVSGNEFASDGSSGKVIVAGSSSVSPVMEKLKEAYSEVNDKVEVEIQMSDSTTGMNSAIDGICDIGMASRELKDSEKEAGLEGIVIAIDGIAVIVNNENPITGITKDEVKNIFTGEITNWSEVQ